MSGGGISSTRLFFRGATIEFATYFYDINGVIVQPLAAFITIEYPDPAGGTLTATVPMSPPNLPVEPRWTGLWDSRGAGPGPVYWSLHSAGLNPPFAVEDGSFELTANPANLVTF